MQSSIDRNGNVRAGWPAQQQAIHAAAHDEPTSGDERRVTQGGAKRFRGMPASEALAIAQLRRYTNDRRQALLGKAARDLDPRGRPGSSSSRTNRYDARLVRCIDFANALSSLEGCDATILQLFYADGESLQLIAAAVGSSLRWVTDRMPIARRALLLALEERNLL